MFLRFLTEIIHPKKVRKKYEYEQKILDLWHFYSKFIFLQYSSLNIQIMYTSEKGDFSRKSVWE